MTVTIKNLSEEELYHLFCLVSGFAYHNTDAPIISACKKAEEACAGEASWETINKVQKSIELALQAQSENPELIKQFQSKFLKIVDKFQDKVDTHNNLNPNNQIEP